MDFLRYLKQTLGLMLILALLLGLRLGMGLLGTSSKIEGFLS